MGKTQRQVFKMCDVDGRTEWATQHGNLYATKKDGGIFVEMNSDCIGDYIGTYFFNTLQDFNKWLNNGLTFAEYQKTQDTTQVDRVNNIYNCIVNLSNDVVRKDYEMTPIERQIFGYIVAMVNNIQKWI